MLVVTFFLYLCKKLAIVKKMIYLINSTCTNFDILDIQSHLNSRCSKMHSSSDIVNFIVALTQKEHKKQGKETDLNCIPTQYFIKTYTVSKFKNGQSPQRLVF